MLFIVWLLGYFNLKRTVQRSEKGLYLLTTVLIAIGFFFLFGINNNPYPLGVLLTPESGAFGIVGDIVCIIGILFAIWARLTLGSNWTGSSAALKESHELVQQGPYVYVRHPIYSGFFFGMLGTAFTLGTVIAYLGVLSGLVAFLIRIGVEERLMSSQFPEYAEYKKRTKSLIPFVL